MKEKKTKTKQTQKHKRINNKQQQHYTRTTPKNTTTTTTTVIQTTTTYTTITNKPAPKTRPTEPTPTKR